MQLMLVCLTNLQMILSFSNCVNNGQVSFIIASGMLPMGPWGGLRAGFHESMASTMPPTTLHPSTSVPFYKAEEGQIKSERKSTHDESRPQPHV